MRNGAGSSAGTYEMSDEEEEDSDKGEAPNATNKQAQILLKGISRRIDVLLDSAARTGVQMALQTVLTWYPQVNLRQLYTMWDGASDLLERTYVEVSWPATTMVDWFSPYDYTPYIYSDGNPRAPTSIAGLADDSLCSSLRPQDAPTPQPA